MDTVAVKACTKCAIKKPASKDFFHKTQNNRGGLVSVCKLCICAEKREREGLARDLKKRTEVAQEYYNAVEYGRAFKVCAKCKLKKPATEEFFSPDAQRKYGLYSACKSCHKTYSQAWQQANSNKVKATQRIYLASNSEKIKARAKAYDQANPEKSSNRARNRRARKLAAEGTHTDDDVRKQLQAQKNKCWWCGCKLINSGKGKYHADHREPLSKGGRYGPDNIVCACPTCNLSKNAKMPLEFAGRLF